MIKPTLTEEEIALFRTAVRDVQPLQVRSNRAVMVRPILAPRRQRSRLEATTATEIIEVSDFLRETVSAEQALFFARPNLPGKLLQLLKLGKIRPATVLDLHGYTVASARTMLAETLAMSWARGMRCLRVIHGKGKLKNTEHPILKNQVNNWLQQYEYVLAFCSAQPRDGGTGAVYVLLKNRHKKNC